ncbi:MULTISPECIES: LytR/AlgR family response regulator transcription factor [Myroides]|uniref:Response regulator n=1 Tax=Myroides albus TaxID=2562892 RepID=A0A6I3LKJ1_9FLAO|nr:MULTISPECIES: LytTR family DNA-binding domain-containing protein [Myroides]MTG97031.1 response regulator [Myroides albus]MVX35797.1 response regulator [Myroides sp. LoEW2-1]UVD78545.1 LytTR family DNA-binding domain-containing protein [Myroides albus]
MRIAIVEDESLASNYLKSLLERQDIIHITDITLLSSVQEATRFFLVNKVDLIFMDIHLGDGKSLEIFENVEVKSPIIFVTAYDSYAIQVFKQFTIDYILKPFTMEELEEALQKFHNIVKQFEVDNTLKSLVLLDEENSSEIRKRFLVHNGHKLKSIESNHIAYFVAEGKHLFLHTFDNNSYIYDDTLKDVIKKLDTDYFFKINRKYIVNINSVSEIIKHNSQKIEIKLQPNPEEESPILVSKSQIHELKAWLS